MHIIWIYARVKLIGILFSIPPASANIGMGKPNGFGDS